MISAKEGVKLDDKWETLSLINTLAIKTNYSDAMKNSSKQIDRKILKTLEPLNRLNPILLDELAAKSILDEVPAGKIICRHGEKDSRQIYLISGQIEVVTPGETKTRVIKSKSALKTPLTQGSPHNVTLKAKTATTLLYIDADLLELLMSDEPQLNAAYEVTEIEADTGDDWMLTFLQSPAFLQLPTENIQKLLTHLEEIPAKKDQVVIKQGGTDENYYIIKSGSCNVHRQPYAGSANVLLATLPTGSGFGEEALISNASRNATITMRENGSLMRLKKKDFLTLLINPLIKYFEHNETQSKLDEGCVVIDVRTEDQSKQKPIDGAVNIPLSMLRVKLGSLNADREYLLICNDGSQSAAAAFLFIQHGLKCSVLKGGLNSSNSSKSNAKTQATKKPAKVAESKQVVEAKKQAEQIASQQQQIKAAREKAERDIIRHKKELSESRARIAEKKTAQKKTSSVNAQARNSANVQHQKEAAASKLRSEEMMKKSAAVAEQTRKKAEQEAALIKQRALEEAEQLRAEKAAQELAKAEAESKAIELRQKETNEAMRRAEEMMKKSTAAAEQARKQAEEEAVRIKQRAKEEAEYLRAEVEAERKKMEQDAARLKEEEKIIKTSALKIKNEADEIRRDALNDAQQVRSEIEATRALLDKKLQQTQVEEKRKHDAILAEAKKQADKIAASKTQQAAAEAEAIRQKAKEDATRLHNELEQTRKQIEAEATRVISDLKEKSKKAAAEQEVREIKEEVLVEIVAESKPLEESVDYKSVSIPGMSPVEPLNDIDAKRKAEVIKAKLARSQPKPVSQQPASAAQAADVKVHKTNDKTILESNDDLFIFKEPEIATKQAASTPDEPVVAHRTQAESALTQISIKPTQQQKSVVIYPKQEQKTAHKNNPFLNQDNSQTSTSSSASATVSAASPQQFNKQAYIRKQNTKSNSFAIAASFLMILAGAIFTLHATNTLKIQSIAALFNSGNDTVQPATAIAKTKTIRKKVLRADTKVNIKKKVDNKMDNIMQNWKDVLSEAENPKKSQ